MTVSPALREGALNACGTCRVIHRQFPDDFKDVKRRERRSGRGDMRRCRIEGEV